MSATYHGGGRSLIVNADDFGQSSGINEGIIQAHEHGVVSSTTMMVRWPGAEEAASYARKRRELGVGLHFDLGEWILDGGEWKELYSVVDSSDAACVAEELDRQLSRFQDLVGRPPTHIDSHQHTHQKEPARSIVLAAADRVGVPVRSFSATYCGRFYGQDEHAVSHPDWITVKSFLAILDDLRDPVTEVCCHPAAHCDGLNSMYSSERLLELETLCNPEVKNALMVNGIRLIHFGTLSSVGA